LPTCRRPQQTPFLFNSFLPSFPFTSSHSSSLYPFFPSYPTITLHPYLLRISFPIAAGMDRPTGHQRHAAFLGSELFFEPFFCIPLLTAFPSSATEPDQLLTSQERSFHGHAPLEHSCFSPSTPQPEIRELLEEVLPKPTFNPNSGEWTRTIKSHDCNSHQHSEGLEQPGWEPRLSSNPICEPSRR
jgi:hypothetical protein